MKAGEEYPLHITRVWDADGGSCNGQVQLDGTDTLWVTSVTPVLNGVNESSPGYYRFPGTPAGGAPADFAAEPIMQFFEFKHLPSKLQVVSRPFGELAARLLDMPRNAERSVALRKLLEAKDAAVRAVLLLVVLLLPALAFAQDTAPAAGPSVLQTLAAQFLTPTGIATIVGTIASIIFGLWKLTDLRRKQLAQGVYHAFHFVEDLSVTTENTIDDKVAAGLKALDDYFRANGWRPLKPGEAELAKLGFTALNGETKVAEKLAVAAAKAKDEAAVPPAP